MTPGEEETMYPDEHVDADDWGDDPKLWGGEVQEWGGEREAWGGETLAWGTDTPYENSKKSSLSSQ
jgi:hypothetical protein